ncbi:HAMP domain-containing sensor histidine kinase [Clostridium sp. BJN0001]|uniref:sensor histidine kinase n=1 Tax=Clostridium sp. BJN0001 TaxID=2930219 RepID=UPI001FD54BAF|nr:HAMP domain-containing sensor histidine kinase [Clostridium sp. BJN0001]
MKKVTKILNNKNIIKKSAFIIVFTFLLHVSIISENFKLFYRVNSVFTFAIMASLISNIFFGKRIIKNYYKNGNLIILICIIIILLKIYQIDRVYYDYFEIYCYLIGIIISELEIIQLRISVQVKCIFGINMFKIINAGIIIPSLTIYFVGLYLSPYWMIIVSSINFILVNVFILYNFIKIEKNKQNIFIEEHKYNNYIILFMYSISIKANIYIFFYLNNYNFLISLLAISSVITYIVYKRIVVDIFTRSFFYLKNDLKKKRENNERLREYLHKRNKILLDKENLIMKGIRNYKVLIDDSFDGMISFKNKKARYMNKKAMSILNIKNLNDIFNMNISQFIEKYFNVDKNIYLRRKKSVGHIKTENGEKYVEIFFQPITDEYFTIYINSTSIVDEKIKIKQEMNKLSIDFNEKTKFYMNVSHELQTPINLIYSAVQLNEIYIQNNDFEKLSKNTKAIEKNSLRLARTINNFVFAEKINKKNIDVNIEKVDIGYIISRIVLCCEKYTKLNLSSIIFDNQTDGIFALCDEELITYAILSIISNAVKYGKKNGIIAVSLKQLNNERILIAIENDGPLISQDKIPYIFDIFTCINKSLDRLKEGSGIGLFIAKSLIKLQGGSIEFSHSGLGNKFEIILRKSNNNRRRENHFPKINSLKRKVDVEFSDIYFN